MHKMSLKGEALVGNMLFTRVVKVKLYQSVGFVADGESASGNVIHLNCVAVVDDVQCYGLIVQFEGREFRGLGILDIDRRLGVAQRTGGKGRIKFAPMFRIFCPRVSPVRWMGVLSIAEGGQSNH